MRSGKDILTAIHKKWLLMFLLEIWLFGMGPAVLVYATTRSLLLSAITFSVIVLILSIFLKPWNYSLKHVSQYLDSKLPHLEYSTFLLIQEKEELTPLAKLQRIRVTKELENALRHLKPERNIKFAIILAILLLFGAWVIYQFDLVDHSKGSLQLDAGQEMIFSPVDTTIQKTAQPSLKNQSVKIRYPSYTNQTVKTTADMNIRELQGATITWYLEFDQVISKVTFQNMGEDHDMSYDDETYTFTTKLTESGFYNFKFIDNQGRSYFSELYSLEAVKDQNPTLEVSGLPQFTSFEVDQNKELSFEVRVTDDYGIHTAAIIATVSKGSGESVKFREEKLGFDNEIPKYSRQLVLKKKIDLDQMEMTPGDELYFYVEVADVKRPVPNMTRGETYFAHIRDTVSDVFEVEGSMGVDQMPDYFRSQRQLIIDTEKLIKEKPMLSKKEFNSKSNELAFDQKALRIKYGEFMGDESTLDMNVEQDAHDEDEENMLAAYEHAHDSENESNLVEEDHEEDHEEEHGDEHEEGEEEDPLHDYAHNHDDPEEATLYTKSLKAKLRMALNEMWDAELHLRLYHPEQSLPIQYRILERLQEIKNSARIYVHRIGFDPPPIKEDKRLTGDLEEVYSYKKTADIAKEVIFPNIRKSMTRLEVLIQNQAFISEQDQSLFEAAGNEMAALAVEQPGRYLDVLQGLKKLGQGFELSQEEMLEIQNGLLLALPAAAPAPNQKISGLSALDELYMKELETND